MAAHAPAIELDAESGRIVFLGCAFSSASTLGDVPAHFEVRTQEALVHEQRVPCTFANATADEGGTRYSLALRFERDRLVSLFITIEPKHLQQLTDDAFYASIDERWRVHERWLAAMGVPEGVNDVGRSAVGVARDKSENVYIYLHTEHNTWAR